MASVNFGRELFRQHHLCSFEQRTAISRGTVRRHWEGDLMADERLQGSDQSCEFASESRASVPDPMHAVPRTFRRAWPRQFGSITTVAAAETPGMCRTRKRSNESPGTPSEAADRRSDGDPLAGQELRRRYG